MSLKARIARIEKTLPPGPSAPPLSAYGLAPFAGPDGSLDDAKVLAYADRHPGALILGNPIRESLVLEGGA